MNTAQHIVQLSVMPENDGAKWEVVAMAYGGTEHKGKRRGLWVLSGHRFADGSAVSYTPSGSPVEFLGTFTDEP